MTYKIIDQDNAEWLRLDNLTELQFSEWFTHNDIKVLTKTLDTGVCAVIQNKLLRLVKTKED